MRSSSSSEMEAHLRRVTVGAGCPCRTGENPLQIKLGASIGEAKGDSLGEHHICGWAERIGDATGVAFTEEPLPWSKFSNSSSVIAAHRFRARACWLSPAGDGPRSVELRNWTPPWRQAAAQLAAAAKSAELGTAADEGA